MPRLQPIDPDDDVDLAQVFGIKRDTLGFVPNSARTIARWPELAKAYGALSAAVSGTRHISGELANLVFLMASTASGCRYCQAHSAGSAVRRGVDEEKIAAVWDFESSDLFSAAERAALRLGAAAAHAPSLVTDEHFGELRSHFTEDAIVEIVGVIAFSGFMNRWNATVATTLEDEPRRAAARLLGAAGWEVGIHGERSEQ